MRIHLSVCVTAIVTVLALSGCSSSDSASAPAGISIATTEPSLTLPSVAPVATSAPTAGLGAPSSARPAPVRASAKPSPAKPAAVGACRSKELRLSAGPAQPYASTRRSTITALSTSATACTLDGIGTVSLVDAKGKVLSRGKQAEGVDATRVTVRPRGSKAYLRVSWQVVPVEPGDGPSSCYTGTGLRIVLPGDTATTTVPIQITACDKGAVDVEPWAAKDAVG